MDTGVEQPSSGERFARRLTAVPRSVPVLREGLTAWVRQLGVADDQVQAVRLAVSEAVTNAVMHAFIDAEPGTVEVSARPGRDVLEVSVTDDGRGMGPRPDSPGLGMGVPMIGKLCATVDLAQGPGGAGTEVRMIFAVPGLVAGPVREPDHLDDILRALTRMGAGEGFGVADISALVDLVVPRLADLCSVTLLDEDGTARRLSARVARRDGSLDEAAGAWVMDFPVNGDSSPSRQAAVTGRTMITTIDREWAYGVAPDAERAEALLGLGLTWWAAVPLYSGQRAVGSVAVAGRSGHPEPVVSTLERIAEQAGGLVATARLVADLRRSQTRLQRILGALTEAVTVADADGEIVYANAAATELLASSSADELRDVDGLASESGPASALRRSVHPRTGQTRWLRTTSTLLDDGPLTVRVTQDLTASAEAEQRQRLLAQAGDILAAALGRPDACEQVARVAVPAIADGCAVDLLDAGGGLRLGAVHHGDEPQRQALERSRRNYPPATAGGLVPGAPSDVLATGRLGVLNELTDELLQLGAHDDAHLEELRGLGLRSVLTVPLTLHGRTLGLMTLANDLSGRAFSEGDVTLAQDLAHRAAIAVDSARLEAESARTHAELEESLRRLRLLADAGFGGLVRGIGDQIIEANRTFLDMVGYETADELPPWPQMTPPEWAAADARAVAQMHASGTAELFEKEYFRGDGRRVRVLIGATNVDPVAFEWVAVVVNVGDRLRVDPLRESGLDRLSTIGGPTGSSGEPREDAVADVVGGLAAAVLIQRPGEGIVYANQAAADAMGMRSPQEVVAATPEQIAEGWDTFDEDGVPLEPPRYPSRRILLGESVVEPLTVRAVNRRTGREYWRTIRARPVYASDGTLAMVVSLTEDITETRRAMLTQRLLAEAGAVLSSSLDLGDTLPRLVALAVPELADWCSVVMPDESGTLRQVAVAHVDPEKVRFAEEYDRRWAERRGDPGGAAEVMRTGRAALLAEIPEAFIEERIGDPDQRHVLRNIGMRSVIQVPMAPAGGQPVGVLSLVHAESERVFAPADLALAEELGRRAGTAIQNARLHAERSHIAATLQSSLLPDELPHIPGFRLASDYRPAGKENWVGGDFYDVFRVAGGFMAIVGDVAGHGAEAAALTAQARHTLRAIGEASGDPVAAVAHLNRLLVPRAEPALCTVCAVLVRVADDGVATAEIVCAGHPLPCLVRGGQVDAVGAYGPLLGAWESAFSTTEVALRSDDVLVIYTDGVLERRDGPDRFGEPRLHATLAGATGADDAVARVEAALAGFGGGEPSDDTAVLAIQCGGGPVATR